MAIPTEIRDSLRALGRSGVVPAAGARLDASRTALDQRLADRVLTEIEAYSVTSNPDVAPRLKQHVAAITQSLQSWFSGDPAPVAEDVAVHARWCADVKFPLEAVLLGYATMQQDLLVWLREAALQSADASAQVPRVVADITQLLIRVSELHTALATAEYVAQTRAVAESEGDQRTRLLELLLHGYDESDSRAAALLRRSGYLEQRQSYCVVIAQPVDATEMQNPARARRLRDALTKAVGKVAARSLIAEQDKEVVAIVSRTRRVSGWTPQQSDIADALRTPLRRFGNSIIIGVSNDAPSTSHVASAYREAALALELASVGNRVSFYANVSLRQIVLHTAGDTVRTSLPVWASALENVDAASKGKMTKTLRAYADSSMNVQQAAKLLGAHPNTLYVRFQKIEDATGKNPLVFHDLNELLLAADCLSQTHSGLQHATP